MFVGQTEFFAASIDKFRTGLAMRLVGACDFGNSFPDQTVRNDELRPAIVVFFRIVESVEKCLHIFLVDFLNVEAVSLKTRARVFTLGSGCRRVERHRVAIVNKDQIIETEVSRESSCLGCYAFLHATVTGKTDYMLIKNPVLGRVET